MPSHTKSVSVILALSCVLALQIVLAACSVETNSPSPEELARSAGEDKKLKVCSGEGGWVRGIEGLECGGTYKMCDNETILRVVCNGEEGTATCQCYTNGVDGPAFDGIDTCSTAARKGQWEVLEARFKAGCGWEQYTLHR